MFDFLLRFQYPKDKLRRVRDRNSQLEYSVPFDINLRDVSGQTVLYLACCVGNLKIVESLLNYKVSYIDLSISTYHFQENQKRNLID